MGQQHCCANNSCMQQAGLLRGPGLLRGLLFMSSLVSTDYCAIVQLLAGDLTCWTVSSCCQSMSLANLCWTLQPLSPTAWLQQDCWCAGPGGAIELRLLAVLLSGCQQESPNVMWCMCHGCKRADARVVCLFGCCVLQAAYQEVQAFAKYGGAGTKSVAGFTVQRGSSGMQAMLTMKHCSIVAA